MTQAERRICLHGAGLLYQFIWEKGRGWTPRGGWGKCFGAVVQTQTSPRNLCKDLGWGVCVPLPYVSYRNKLKTNGYYSEEPSTRPLQHPTPRQVPKNPKTLCTLRNPGSMSTPCVRVNLSLYSGHLMSCIWIFILWRQSLHLNLYEAKIINLLTPLLLIIIL